MEICYVSKKKDVNLSANSVLAYNSLIGTGVSVD